ncbi:hypothetical protein [Burkholderia sp. PU8-34]
MYKTAFALGLSVLLSACAVNQDGVHLGVGSAPSDNEITKARKELEKNASESSAKKLANDVVNRNSKPGVVLIGDVGPFRAFDNDTKAKEYNKQYVHTAAAWHPEHPDPYLSKADFVNTIAGWTSVQVFGIPGLMNLRIPAMVPAGLDKSINFASGFGSFFIGTTGDLVAGLSNDDGWVILTRVLCKDSSSTDGGSAYRICAANYARGRFDASTGRELGDGLTPKSGGSTIDVNTYKRIDATATVGTIK